MKSTRHMARPNQRFTALIAVCLWLFSSIVAFYLPGHAHAAAHNAAGVEAPGHQMLQTDNSKRDTLSRASPCPNHKKVVEAHTGSETQNLGSPHGIHCADNCAMSSCGGTAVALLPVAQGFAVNGDVRSSFVVFQSVRFLPPDPIYRPPLFS